MNFFDRVLSVEISWIATIVSIIPEKTAIKMLMWIFLFEKWPLEIQKFVTSCPKTQNLREMLNQIGKKQRLVINQKK